MNEQCRSTAVPSSDIPSQHPSRGEGLQISILHAEDHESSLHLINPRNIKHSLILILSIPSETSHCISLFKGKANSYDSMKTMVCNC